MPDMTDVSGTAPIGRQTGNRRTHSRTGSEDDRTDMLPAIIIPAFNRPLELQRLLDSVLLSFDTWSGPKPPIIVSIDGGDEAVCAVVRRYAPHGVDVRVQPRLGLREHILLCGDMVSEFGAVMVLEDDLILAPSALPYAKAALAYSEQHTSIAAISLYSFQNNDFSHCENIRSECVGDVFLLRTASSWGQIWRKDKWKEFRDWLENNYEADEPYRVPDRVKRWPETSWKKLYNFWLSDTRQWTLAPFFSVALCSGGITGSNVAGIVGPHFSRVRSMPTTPVMTSFDDLMRLDEFMEVCIQHSELYVPGSNVRVDQIEFDLNSTKRKVHITKDYILTRRIHNDIPASRELDASLGNPLLALTTGAKGKGLWLVPKDSFKETAPIYNDNIEFRLHMPWASTKFLCRQSIAAVSHAVRTKLGVRVRAR